jgi:hypothetical protein
MCSPTTSNDTPLRVLLEAAAAAAAAANIAAQDAVNHLALAVEAAEAAVARIPLAAEDQPSDEPEAKRLKTDDFAVPDENPADAGEAPVLCRSLSG